MLVRLRLVAEQAGATCTSGCFKGAAGAVFALSPNPKLDFETCV